MDYEQAFKAYEPFSIHKNENDRTDTYVFYGRKAGKPFARMFCFAPKTEFTAVLDRMVKELRDLEGAEKG